MSDSPSAERTPIVKNTRGNFSRLAYTFDEFAQQVGKHRSWVYRQVSQGRIHAITGYGSAMIPVTEIARIFGSTI